MCGGFPNSSTQGKPAPRQTFWQAFISILRGGRWYDAVSRPDHNSGCGDPGCKDPNCTYGKGKPRCQNCGDPIANGIYCGMCREMGCTDTSQLGKSQ
jgi:hypothetical protein